MIGYIGANELEHALSIVADDAETQVRFHTIDVDEYHMTSSVSSLAESEDEDDPFDFSMYMDQVCVLSYVSYHGLTYGLLVSTHSSGQRSTANGAPVLREAWSSICGHYGYGWSL